MPKLKVENLTLNPKLQEPNIIAVDITDELQRSYLEYSLSVILSRALPDVRDGLKPVQRRIIYAMYEMGLTPEKPFKKCATVIGEVLGRYHPHGDSAVYDALVRLAQDFSMRYPLIIGQGNFGSIDGDSPAAYRYTEAKLSETAMTMLEDIDEDTVDFKPNFDGSREEPTVLPAKFPNLLVNGSIGIAVGMSTSIPPHNLREVAEAIIAYIKNPRISDNQLMKIIPGPDFPTGGMIVNRKQVIKAYKTGKAIITLECRYKVVEDKRKRYIVITEIPYNVNKVKLLESIAAKVRDRVIPEIVDIIDSSDMHGIQISLELKPDANVERVINLLRKHTDFRTSMLVQLIAVNGVKPKLYTLKELIAEYVQHRQQVIERRTRYRLNKASARIHLLEGLLIILDNLDRAIRLIRTSANSREAKEKLVKDLGLSEEQADYVLKLQLMQLTRKQRGQVEDELRDLRAKVEEYKRILADPKIRDEIIVSELQELVERFGDARRTGFYERDPFKEVKRTKRELDEEFLLLINRDGYYNLKIGAGSSKLASELRAQFQGPVEEVVGRALDNLALFLDTGYYMWFKLRKLSQTEKPLYIGKELNIQPNERVVKLFLYPRLASGQRKFEGTSFIVVTRSGRVKRLALENVIDNLGSSRRARYTKLDNEDRVLKLLVTDKQTPKLLLLSSSSHISLIDDIPAYGKSAKPVIGIRLRDNSWLTHAWILPDDCEKFFLFLLSEDWKLVSVPVSSIPLQRRGSRGVKLPLSFKSAWLGRDNMVLRAELMDRTTLTLPWERLVEERTQVNSYTAYVLRHLLPIDKVLRIELVQG